MRYKHDWLISQVQIPSIHKLFLELQVLRDAQLFNTKLAYIDPHILPDTGPWPDGKGNPWRDDNGLLHEN